ncbi:MAG: aspartate carbamoyltransferase [Chloroflexi bacterium]|nr:aspartate carbamoyltransferase [Chloroflexota bacterium]MXX83690.1 aspartate carbamoyltransferase [Chloroflexota bacterium]MYA93227.1 aspartate carbamoyltransferase [Chloroflexota bacterium]MYC55412.1 aspartate carbamoyltransferase [Chloroflexota bacterium]MYD38534.1 aspartate carbamoyltransferase [Chloroflexota bacterium]
MSLSQHASSYQPPPINGDFLGKHIISVDQFQRRDLDILFQAATSIRKRIRTQDRGLTELCAGKVMASLFFEASTRTDMSFQAAMRRLGGDVIAVSNGVRFSSMYKGENLSDTIRATGCYSDVIVLRHPEIGSSYEAGYYLDLLNQRIDNPTVAISGGDGIGEHPTQALLDMFTIVDRKKSLDGLTIALVGDLKHGRTVHSLAKLLAYYDASDVRLCLVAPQSLIMPADICALVAERGIQVRQTDDLREIITQTDVIYWTRIQEERFAQASDYQEIKDRFIMTPSLLAEAPADAILMHPLPRKHEMGSRADHDVLDADPRAIYFEQMENGMFLRMALLVKVLRGVYV